MDRREFISWAGTGFIATSLPMAIAACSPSTTEKTETPASSESKAEKSPAPNAAKTPDANGYVAVGSVADLDQAGYVSEKDFPGGSVIVIRDPKDASGIVALSSVCTHEACTVRWRSEKFACACHGSAFAVDGSVTAGPATKPLKSYEAKIDGDNVLVKV